MSVELIATMSLNELTLSTPITWVESTWAFQPPFTEAITPEVKRVVLKRAVEGFGIGEVIGNAGGYTYGPAVSWFTATSPTVQKGQAFGWTNCYWVRAPTACVISKMSFYYPLPVCSDVVSTRLVVYRLSGNVLSDRNYTYADRPSVETPDFWTGKASSVSLNVSTSPTEDPKSYSVTTIIDKVLPQEEVLSTSYIDVQEVVFQEGIHQLVFVCSPYEILDPTSATNGAINGRNWYPRIVYFKD